MDDNFSKCVVFIVTKSVKTESEKKLGLAHQSIAALLSNPSK